MMVKTIGSGSSGNGYALISGEDILLLECGVPAKEMLKAIDYQTSMVNGCILSHIHGDHAGYIEGEFLIDEDTICQYTGLTDKNGKKIYENDIVQIGLYKGTVEYEYASFVIKWINAKFLRNDIGYWARLNDFYTVGNVYDNPELLEECNE